MPAVELVMCAACGRPQEPAELCIQCGAKLPLAVTATPRAPVHAADEPFVEASFGRGRALAISRQRLEWIPRQGAKPVKVELSELASAALAARPVYEALALAALFAAGAALLGDLVLRGALGALAALCVAAALVQRRYSISLLRKGGQRASLYAGIARPRTPAAARIASAWATVAEELSGLGVKAR